MYLLGGAKGLARAYRRWRSFRKMDAAWKAMTREELADDRAEVALWDASLMDGLEDEDWTGFQA